MAATCARGRCTADSNPASIGKKLNDVMTCFIGIETKRKLDLVVALRRTCQAVNCFLSHDWFWSLPDLHNGHGANPGNE